MEGYAPGRWLTDCITPLADTFGERLILQRDGAAARWTFEDQSVVVEMRPGGAIAATFIERPTVEYVSARLAGGVYHASSTGYLPTRDGCRKMVADMLAFFSGTREPRFTFADAYLIDA